jgi:hypothetical protein
MRIMLRQCFFCDRPFPEMSLSAEPVRGCTIAYDPHRGRLWLVCSSCRRWSLTPIEDRWEVLDELERCRRDRARLLAETRNVSLLDAGAVRLVRVGHAGLREEAWWRYGRELTRRHQRTLQILQRGEALDILLDFATPILRLLFVGWPVRRYVEPGVEPWLDRARWRDFGPFAWRGMLRCKVCGSRRDSVAFTEAEELMVAAASDPPGVSVRCPQCRSLSEPESGFQLEGADAARVLRRMLAYQNYDGASERQINAAMTLIDEAGSPADLSRDILCRRVRLGRLKSRELLALEIASNEEDERRLAEEELAGLERSWRAEEEIAAVADSELTPWPA